MSRPAERLAALADANQAGRAISDADARLVARALRTFVAELSRGRDKLLRQEARRDHVQVRFSPTEILITARSVGVTSNQTGGVGQIQRAWARP